jgi:hypothetical protein
MVDHLVLGFGDLDLLRAAQKTDAVDIDVGIGDSIDGKV